MSRPVLILILMLAASPALANDSVFGGQGADLAPVKEDRLKMVSEDIVITEVGKKRKWAYAHWEIKATYTFENPTNEAITAQFGFPEHACDPEGDCNSRDGKKFTFFRMKTTVNGKAAKMRVGTVSKKSTWAPELGRVHLFDVTIPAGKKAKVVHKYEMGKSGTSMADDLVYYVTKTGALWNGPIQDARFTLRLKQRPWGLSFPPGYELESFTTKGKRTEIVFHQKNWTPTHDLTVLLGSDYSGWGPCPSILQTVDMFYDGKKLDVAAATKELAKLSDADLRLCRNMPYAHHGYTFKDEALQKRFYAMSTPTSLEKFKGSGWAYTGTALAEKGAVGVMFAPNKSYRASMLTAREKRWVKALKAVERARKKAKK